jgi:DNA-binding transcriptional LysR family regulator
MLWSNVTAHINALEKELGVLLFDRLGGKQVALTEAGHKLLRYAEQLLELAEEAQAVVSIAEEPQGILRIGAAESLCIYRLPSLLHAFRVRFPRVKVVFCPSPVAELRNLVYKGTIDVAFVYEELDHQGGPRDEMLALEPVCLVAAPDHPFVDYEVVVPADFAATDLLLTETGCCYRGHFERILNRANIYPKTILEFNSIEAVKQCVMAGLGVTLLTAVSVTNEIEVGKLVKLPWGGPDVSVITHLVWHKDKWLSPSLDAFLTLSRELLTVR